MICRFQMTNLMISGCIFCTFEQYLVLCRLLPWKRDDCHSQTDALSPVEYRMLLRPLYCFVRAWLFYPADEMPFCWFWLFMQLEWSFASWIQSLSRRSVGGFFCVLFAGVGRTIGLRNIWLLSYVILFECRHWLEDAFHLPYEGFDEKQATPASGETFALTLLMTRIIARGQTERMAAEVVPFSLMDGGRCSHPRRRLTANWFRVKYIWSRCHTCTYSKSCQCDGSSGFFSWNRVVP